MTIAELHGKLSSSQAESVHERLEDLLTSNVFGTMKYAGWENGFVDWLLKSEPAPAVPVAPPINTYIQPDNISRVEYRFWPLLPNKREPDVALLFTYHGGEFLLVLIEAKYLSGTSDWESEEDIDPFGRTGSQIADQILGLNAMSVTSCLSWFQPEEDSKQSIEPQQLKKIHLYITTHMRLPDWDYEYASLSLPGEWPIPSYWLSWTSLNECLQPYVEHPDIGRKALLADLYKLMNWKGLVPFHGFNMLPFAIQVKFPSFWRENWWMQDLISFHIHESFWNEYYWNIQPIESISCGSFWEG